MPEAIKRLDNPEPQIILMDPLVLKERQAIMSEMSKPKTAISGNLEALAGQQQAKGA